MTTVSSTFEIPKKAGLAGVLETAIVGAALALVLTFFGSLMVSPEAPRFETAQHAASAPAQRG